MTPHDRGVGYLYAQDLRNLTTFWICGVLTSMAFFSELVILGCLRGSQDASGYGAVLYDPTVIETFW